MSEKRAVLDFLASFQLEGNSDASVISHSESGGVPVYTNEFWTAKQRQANPLHEISYRACFKGQLPAFFINLLTKQGDKVYDPFSGRGTTAVESALSGRIPVANDINPLSRILCEPRLADLPNLSAIEERLSQVPLRADLVSDIDLSMFYHPHTLSQILSLREYLQNRIDAGEEENLDRWIRMVATNRLTGHSPGFFSVYTLPPNQATSAKNQIKINEKRQQKPEPRDVEKLILRKSKSLLKSISHPQPIAQQCAFYNNDARATAGISADSIDLTVTSPPFLDVIHYAQDNWLRCWFNGIDVEIIEKKITVLRKLDDWIQFMQDVFIELFRVTKPGGWVAFEVGEVRREKIQLEEFVVPAGSEAGFEPIAILINQQEFTKTANIWGVDNNNKGTNTNRIVLLQKPL